MQEHWAASFFLYVLVIVIVWRFVDYLACYRCGYSRFSLAFRALVMLVALVQCMRDTVHYYSLFGFLDPDLFQTTYTNGTPLGPEWHEQLVFQAWLRWLVVFSPVALLIVTILGLRGLFLAHAHSAVSQSNILIVDEDEKEEALSEPLTTAVLALSGQRQCDKAHMVRLMPAVYVFMSFNSILRIVQLLTGEINYANPRYEGDSLQEKITFCDYMVIGNDNCMALFSAWALLNFGAYLLQGLRVIDDSGAPTDHSESLHNTYSVGHFSSLGFVTVRKLVKSVLFQMLKYYILVNVVQFGYGLFTFFLFREANANGFGLLDPETLRRALALTAEGDKAALIHGSIQGAGVVASMSTWGSISVLSRFTFSTGFQDCNGHRIEVFGIRTDPNVKEHPDTITRLFGMRSLRYNKKFLSVKIMVSLCFLQKMGLRAVASFFGYPTMTHYLIAEVLLVYEAVLLAVFTHLTWVDDPWVNSATPSAALESPLLDEKSA